MIQNETKSPEILKAERQVEQAKARLAEAKRKESAKKRSDENKHKWTHWGQALENWNKVYKKCLNIL